MRNSYIIDHMILCRPFFRSCIGYVTKFELRSKSGVFLNSLEFRECKWKCCAVAELVRINKESLAQVQLSFEF